MKHIVQKNITLLEALAEASPQSSKNTLRSWIKEGRVQIDGIIASQSSDLVTIGQTLLIGPKRKFIANNVEILYEDRDIIVVDKPTGLLSVATAFEQGETVHAILKNYYRTLIFVVHRLDQDTSGVMLFARNEVANEKLKEMFEAHDLERTYIGIIEGHLDELQGVWRSYLYEDAGYQVHTTEDPNRGRLAITHYKTIERYKKYSKVQFTLETGRKNQIRAHCQAAGHPIVGDRKYGALCGPLRRLGLHAYSLAFKHPVTKKMMHFTSPVPFGTLV